MIAGAQSLGTAAVRGAEAWRATLLLLAAALLLWGALFRQEIAAAIGVWRASAAYGHCILVLPLAGWLAWQRRDALAGLAPAPSVPLALLAIGPGLAWLAAERLGVMEGRQLAAIGALWVLALAVLGPRVARAMAAPLGYLVFLVPFGAFAVGPLQRLTGAMIEAGLAAMGTPFHAEGLLIETPAGTFHVAEACAGLRFLIASLAFGAFYALAMFRSPGRRVAVMALALVVPVLANGLRAFGIVALGQALGSAEAAAVDHLIYGWGFFAAILVLLVLLGLPFLEAPVMVRPRGAGLRAGAAPQGLRLVVAAMVALLAPAAAQAAAARLRDAAAGPVVHRPVLSAPAGCTATADGLSCDGVEIAARILAFSPRASWAAVAAARHRAAGSDDLALSVPLHAADGAAWQARSSEARRGWVATAAWLGGRPAGDGLGSRLRQGWNSLAGGGGRPVLAITELRAAEELSPIRARALLEAVLAAQAPGLAMRAATMSQRED